MGRTKKKNNNKISESNVNSAVGETLKQDKQPRKAHSKSSSGEECAILPVIAVEIPREDWPPIPQFKEIEENIILCKDAESKESKSIQCDCKHSSKELKRGKGCGEECLNRLLMMECRGGCPSGKYCTNKHFQRREYAEMELFYTGAKGWGMRAKQDIAQGQFIIEYVGEVVGAREMQRRIRRYGQDPNHKHHYLMALRSGTVIDATTYGNHSRFINHSCDPNAATQKWTVGRQLRIGFFALRLIKAGDEVVFNYQFERYGKRAQKCLCGSSNCTGYIGATGREDSGVDSAGEEGEGGAAVAMESDLSSSESDVGEVAESAALPTAKAQQPKRKKGRPPKSMHKMDRKMDRQQQQKRAAIRPERITDPTLREAAEVGETLLKGPLRNREQVLEFNRLMVRVDQTQSRRRMVDFLLSIEDPNILRLFVAHQGLALIRIWFVLPPFDLRALQLQSQIARLLLRLPVTNKNQVDEVCIMSTLNQMINMELPDKLVITEMVNQMADFVAEEADGPNAIAKPNPDPAVCEFEELRLLAEQLTEKWANLVNSDFRIPKKLSKTVSKLVTKGMAVLQNNKQNKKFVPKWKMSGGGCKNQFNDGASSNDGFGPCGEEPLNENDRDWQYRRFRRHFERRIRRRGGQPFYYQTNNFNGGNMMHLGGQLYNDHTYEPPPSFFNAPHRMQKLFPDPIPYSAVPNSPAIVPHPLAPHFYPGPSPMHPNPYCMPPSPYHHHQHHLYYAQNGANAMIPIPVHVPQPLPPPPPPPPPPAMCKTPENDELEMDLDGDSETEEFNSNNVLPSTSSSTVNNNNSKISIIKEEAAAVVEETETIVDKKGKENRNGMANTARRKEEQKLQQRTNKQQKREKQKSAKDLIQESLQRRIQSLKAQLGTKATPAIWLPKEPKSTLSSADVKVERRWSRSKSASPGSAASRSRPSSATPESTPMNRSRLSSPSKERPQLQKRDDERREPREDRGAVEQHDEAKQHRRRRGERGEEDTRRRRSGPGDGRDRSHGRKGQNCEHRMSLSPDRTGGTDPHIDWRGRRRSSLARKGGRFNGRPRGAMPGKRFFDRRNRGRWPRKTVSDANNVRFMESRDGQNERIPRRRGGTFDRIRAQLAQQAFKHQQLQDKKEETKLSPAEEMQKQRELNSKKAVINAYAERLKGLIQPENSLSSTVSTFSEHSDLNTVLSEMDIVSKSYDANSRNKKSVVDNCRRPTPRIVRQRRSASSSSTSSTSSSTSSSSNTSSDSSTTTSSTTSSSSSTTTDSQENKNKEEGALKRTNSPKGVEPPQQIMLKRMIGADGPRKMPSNSSRPVVPVDHIAQKTAPKDNSKALPLHSAPTPKGRFVAAFKITPSAVHSPIANSGAKSAAVAKAFITSDGSICDGEEEATKSSSFSKIDDKYNQRHYREQQSTSAKTAEQSLPTTAASSSNNGGEDEKEAMMEDCGKGKHIEVIQPRQEERMSNKTAQDNNNNQYRRSMEQQQEEADNDQLKQEEGGDEDEGEMLQPPRVSIGILSDPDRMDAYVHQLKEFVYFVETLRRDMHGPPPMPSSMAAALRQHNNNNMNNMHIPVTPSKSASLLLSSVGTNQPQQQQQHSSSTTVIEQLQKINRSIKTSKPAEEAETGQRLQQEQQQQQAVIAGAFRHGNAKRSKAETTTAATTTRTAIKRERVEEEDVPSPSTSKVPTQPLLTKRSRIDSAERKDAQQCRSAQELRKQMDELQADHSLAASVQASTPPEDPRTTNIADAAQNVPSSSSMSQQQQPQSHLSLSSTVTTVVLSSEPLLSSATAASSSSIGHRSTTVTTTVVEPSLATNQQQAATTTETKRKKKTSSAANKINARGASAAVNPFRHHPSLLNSLSAAVQHMSPSLSLEEVVNAKGNSEPCAVAVGEPSSADEVLSLHNETSAMTADGAASSDEDGEILALAANVSVGPESSPVATVSHSALGEETAEPTFAAAPLMSKSGLWLGARDSDGALYFYHRDTREARWDLPEGEELLIIDKSNVAGGAATSHVVELVGAERQLRRAEFKRHVSALVAKCIDPYRKRFFHANGEYATFLRKITHKVLDNQPKSGNIELLFNEQVQKNTQRLVDEYIRHFKNRESHQLLHHRTDSQGFSPK